MIIACIGLAGCRCKRGTSIPLPYPSVDAIDPDCGSIDGGTVVTIYGFNLSNTSDLTIDGLTVTGYIATAETIVFTTPAHAAGIAPIALTTTGSYTCKNWLGKSVIKTYTKNATAGDFEYVSSPRPVITDANPGQPRINTDPWDGNCGGGYFIEIQGTDFIQDTSGEIPVVVFNGVEIYEPDVRFLSSSRLECRVPAGDQGTWAEIIVKNPPIECEITSVDPGWFYYTQDPCVPIDPSEISINTALADPGPQYLDTGDILDDGGGNKDIAVACEGLASGNGSLIVLEGDGSGEISVGDVLDFPYGKPSGVALGNLDGDAFVDAAVTLIDANEVAILLNTGTGFTLEHTTFYGVGTSPIDVEVIDIDGDGDDDVVVLNQGSRELSFIEQTSPGVLDAMSLPSVGVPLRGSSSSANPVSLAQGDFDGTGGRDLIVGTSSQSIELFTSSSAAAPVAWNAFAEVSATASIVDVQAGMFFSSSTVDDVAALCAGTNTVSLIQYESGAFISGTSVLPLDGVDPHVLATGDYNDGSAGDFAMGNVDDLIEVFMQTGAATDEHETFSLVGTVVSDLVSDWLNSSDPTTQEDLVIGSGAEGSIVTVVVNKGGGFD